MTSARYGSNPTQPDLTSMAISGRSWLRLHTATHPEVEAFNIRLMSGGSLSGVAAFNAPRIGEYGRLSIAMP
jgi:hypothetical protein